MSSQWKPAGRFVVGTGLVAVALVLASRAITGPNELDAATLTSANAESATSSCDPRIARAPLDSETAADALEVAHQAPVAQEVTRASCLSAPAIQLAIETTVVGQMNPGEFLDMALELSGLAINPDRLIEPSPSGATRYEFLGVPQGVNAEVWNQLATGENFGLIMTYKISVPPPDGYVFEGALRKEVQVQITIWTDKQYRLRHFGILTDIHMSEKTIDLGLGWHGRSIPTGATFFYDTDRPGEWRTMNNRLDSGQVRQSADPALLIVGEWPRLDDLDRLKLNSLQLRSQL